MATSPMTSQKQLKQDRMDDGRLLLIFLLVASVAIVSAPLRCPMAAWVAILATDFYLFVVLVLAALRTDHGLAFKKSHPWVPRWFPRRTAGFFLILLLLASIVFGFAGLYVGPDVFQCEKGWLDAIYISFQTLGFSDFDPKAGYGQFVVIVNLASGVLLLIGAFPLLISRM